MTKTNLESKPQNFVLWTILKCDMPTQSTPVTNVGTAPCFQLFLPPRHCQIVLPDPSVLGRAHVTTPSQQVHRWVTAFNCQCKDSPSRALPHWQGIQGPLDGYPGPSESRAHLPNGMEYSLREKKIFKSLGWWWVLLPRYNFVSLIGFPGGSVVKNLPANAGDMGLIPGPGRSPEEGNGNPL